MATRGWLAKRILEKANQRRSPLYRWLRENHADIAQAMTRPRPSWTALAEAASEAGQVDAAGKPPNASSIRAAWLRVCRDLEAGRDGASKKPARAVTRKTNPLPIQPDEMTDLDDDPPPRSAYTFRPGKLRE
jgi:hypothetical protein